MVKPSKPFRGLKMITFDKDRNYSLKKIYIKRLKPSPPPKNLTNNLTNNLTRTELTENDIVEDYENGVITAEQALGQLIYKKVNHQICILNQDIIDKYLKFILAE